MKRGKWLLIPISFFILFLDVSAQSALNWRYTVAPHFRQIKGVHFNAESNFSLVGGNETNDAIASIFTTSDTGNTYGLNWDNVYHCINDVASITPLNAVAVGDSGLVIVTQDNFQTWDTILLSGNIAGRNYHGIWFTSTTDGYAVGGNPSMDSIQTIIKTTDGGLTWVVQSDNLGPMLREVHFLNATTGFVVGDSSTLLKTTNAGANWVPVVLPSLSSKRVFQQIKFLDTSNGFIAGGMPGPDSMFTLLKTVDGGGVWTVAGDSVGSMMNDFDFFNANEGYLVGDDGLIFYSSDAGLTWVPENLPLALVDTFSFQVVEFLNSRIGIFGGRGGKVIIRSNFVVDRLNEKLGSAFQLFPNPNSGRFALICDGPLSGAWKAELINLQGKVVFSNDVNANFSNKIEINIHEELPSELYIFKLSSEQGQSHSFRFFLGLDN